MIERTHLAVKAVADRCKNTIRFERSVLAGVLNFFWSSNSSGNFIHSLLGRTVAVGNGVWTTSMMVTFGCHIGFGDIIKHCDACGVVQVCLLIDTVMHAAVAIMERDGDHSAPWGLWNLTGHHACWLAGDLVHVVAWKAAAGDRFLVLV